MQKCIIKSEVKMKICKIALNHYEHLWKVLTEKKKIVEISRCIKKHKTGAVLAYYLQYIKRVGVKDSYIKF